MHSFPLPTLRTYAPVCVEHTPQGNKNRPRILTYYTGTSNGDAGVACPSFSSGTCCRNARLSLPPPKKLGDFRQLTPHLPSRALHRAPPHPPPPRAHRAPARWTPTPHLPAHIVSWRGPLVARRAPPPQRRLVVDILLRQADPPARRRRGTRGRQPRRPRRLPRAHGAPRAALDIVHRRGPRVARPTRPHHRRARIHVHRGEEEAAAGGRQRRQRGGGVLWPTGRPAEAFERTAGARRGRGRRRRRGNDVPPGAPVAQVGARAGRTRGGRQKRATGEQGGDGWGEGQV